MGESLSSTGPGAWGGSGSRDRPPPRRSETEKGIEEVREGTPFGDGVWMLAAMSESLHRFL